MTCSRCLRIFTRKYCNETFIKNVNILEEKLYMLIENYIPLLLPVMKLRCERSIHLLICLTSQRIKKRRHPDNLIPSWRRRRRVAAAVQRPSNRGRSRLSAICLTAFSNVSRYSLFAQQRRMMGCDDWSPSRLAARAPKKNFWRSLIGPDSIHGPPNEWLTETIGQPLSECYQLPWEGFP